MVLTNNVVCTRAQNERIRLIKWPSLWISSLLLTNGVER